MSAVAEVEVLVAVAADVGKCEGARDDGQSCERCGGLVLERPSAESTAAT